MKRIYLPPAPPASSPAIRASMQGNKPLKTKPESILKDELEKAGIGSFKMNYKKLPGSPDIAFSDAKLAIFLHGCFWHRCPYCHPHFPNLNQEYWSAKFARNKRRDSLVRTELRAQGWRPIVVWECKLKKNPQRIVYRIRKTLEATCE